MQGKHMALEGEVPHQRIKIIRFLVEIDIEVICQDIGDFIKSFKAAIVIYDCFGTAEVGA
jgi:hypothetical protein